MALKPRIGKADHESLEESLKSLYIADGEDFVLDLEGDDGLSGLRSKKEELLAELGTLKKTFEGIDPAAARKAVSELEAARREKMTAEERHTEDLKDFQKKLDAANQRSKALLNTQAERDLERALAKHLRAEKIEDASIILRAKNLKWDEQDGKPVWKTLSGEPVDFDTFIPSLQSTKGDWFEAKTQTGGGATGSGNSAGNGNTIKRAQYDANPAQYSAQIGRGELSVVD